MADSGYSFIRIAHGEMRGIHRHELSVWVLREARRGGRLRRFKLKPDAKIIVGVPEHSLSGWLNNNRDWLSSKQFQQVEKVDLRNRNPRLTMVPSGCFCHLVNLKTVILNEAIDVIGMSAFQGCVSLDSISLPWSLRVIEDRAFYGCSAIRQLNFPDGVREIHRFAFAELRALAGLRLPQRLELIGDGAFSLCPHLTELVLPGGVKRFGNPPFSFCPLQIVLLLGSDIFEYIDEAWRLPHAPRIAAFWGRGEMLRGVVITPPTDRELRTLDYLRRTTLDE